MKKISFFIMIFLITGCLDQSLNYAIGKDTVVIVGDGKFQIGKYPTSLKLEMFDKNKNSIKIIDKVKGYKNIQNNLYVIGDDESYSIVNGENNTCKLYSLTPKRIFDEPDNIIYLDNYENFREEEKKIFEGISD